MKAHGFDPLPIDALYEQCRTEVLTQDPAANFIDFALDERGLLKTCTYVPMGCADDCTQGVTISDLVLVPSVLPSR
jgi:hypothetical protein